MVKEKAEKEKKLFVRVILNYAAELKILLTALLILCILVTLLQFSPSRFTLSTSDLHFCICKVNPPAQAQALAQAPAQSDIATTAAADTALLSSPAPSSTPFPPPPPSVELDKVLSNGILKRAFNPYGSAAYTFRGGMNTFITMGAYRGGMNTFAIVGMSSKPLHDFSNPEYECQWAINADNSGGKLLLLATTEGDGNGNFNTTDIIQALTEAPGTLNAGIFTAKPQYDYLYCGSPLFDNLSPQRVREWIAYHVRLFGQGSHFVFNDAGGIHEEVLEVLKPWMELGYITLQDIKVQERFAGYYHNQFMVLNDCLHRYKFMAKWVFFFDVDEFIYMPPNSNIKLVLDSLSDYTQFTIEQMPMSNKLCVFEDYSKIYRKWGFEKLVYRDVKRGIHSDRKYAVQPHNVYAAGLINATEAYVDDITYVMDTTMISLAGSVKEFELRMIGDRKRPDKNSLEGLQLS
ncbi:hypothetical protein D8674_002747 [Pyrus ussuriensis x Pyrus communis]|uniref:Glycosyltransferase family 92 protein n=1 Tax=Pyrus ussuriensis x Pyrus communis TaxID=2448454 RepID=A0A5N5FKK5_9ROSA|nr:hypothetical protein D8674_002747 [Pyrus ussuriensis x Pyrus communis]